MAIPQTVQTPGLATADQVTKLRQLLKHSSLRRTNFPLSINTRIKNGRLLKTQASKEISKFVAIISRAKAGAGA